MGLYRTNRPVPSRGVSLLQLSVRLQMVTNFAQQKSPRRCNSFLSRSDHVRSRWTSAILERRSTGPCRCLLASNAPQGNCNRRQALIIWYPLMLHVQAVNQHLFSICLSAFIQTMLSLVLLIPCFHTLGSILYIYSVIRLSEHIFCLLHWSTSYISILYCPLILLLANTYYGGDFTDR